MSSQVIHSDVICDECGGSPLVGIRYRSRVTYDYEVCQSCMAELGDAKKNDYVAIEIPMSAQEANRIGPPHDTALRVFSLREAAERIGQNEPGRTYAFLHVRNFNDNNTSCTPDLEAALAQNNQLKTIHIHFCGFFRRKPDKCSEAVVGIARGLMRNQSIDKIFLSIPRFTHKEKSGVALALRQMIEQNTAIRALFLLRVCYCDSVSYLEDPDEDTFSATVMEGLRTNATIEKFRLDCYSALSDTTKEQLLAIVKRHCSLTKAFIDFQHPDYRLALFVASNRHKWMERLADVDASEGDRVQVLAEVQKCETIDTICSTFHLLRSCPDMLA